MNHDCQVIFLVAGQISDDGFAVTVKYDQNPAPLPIPSGVPAGTVFATSLGTPFAEKVDTLTEATVIYSFF